MFRFNHSLKKAGRKGRWTSTGKDYTTEHSNPRTPVSRSCHLEDSSTRRFRLWGCLGLCSLWVGYGERAAKEQSPEGWW